MSVIPISASSEFVCLADEGSIAALSAASLRQTCSFPVASVIAIFAEASSQQKSGANNTAVTVVDADGTVTSYSLSGDTAGKVVQQYPHPLTKSSTAVAASDGLGSISVVAAKISRSSASGLFSASSMMLPVPTPGGGPRSSLSSNSNNKLIVSALLSCGTVVHGPLNMAAPVPAIGHVEESMDTLSNILFASSPVAPLVVLAQVGSQQLHVFYAGDDSSSSSSSLSAVNNKPGQDAAATTAASSTHKNNQLSANKKTGGANKKGSAAKNTDNSSNSNNNNTPSNNHPSSVPSNQHTAQSPVAVAAITVHPTRNCVAIGGVRGEIVVIHDVLEFAGVRSSFSTNTAAASATTTPFADHWHHTPVTALAFGGGPDGNILLSGASEGCLCLWNVGSNYARTNISLGAGIADVARITSIQLATDEPSKCIVCVGEGDVQVATIDLSHRRLIARRDGLTAGATSLLQQLQNKGGSVGAALQQYVDLTKGATTSGAAANEQLGVTMLSPAVTWLAGSAVTAVFLYSRTSGRVRLYDPFERRSLRSSVLTASVETVAHPPTVGLQFVAATPDAKRVVCFESSAEPVMPPVLRWLAYDERVRRFVQSQQAMDPHSGEGALTAAVWFTVAPPAGVVVNDDDDGGDDSASSKSSSADDGDDEKKREGKVRGEAALVTCSANRIKLWRSSSSSSSSFLQHHDSSMTAAVQAVRRAVKNNNNSSEVNSNSSLMHCAVDVVVRHHPVLSLLGSITCAAASADGTVLFVASDAVAVIDLTAWTTRTGKTTGHGSSAAAGVVVASPTASSSSSASSRSSSSYGPAVSIQAVGTCAAVVAYRSAVAVFDVVAPGGRFSCRRVLLSSPGVDRVLAMCLPFRARNGDVDGDGNSGDTFSTSKDDQHHRQQKNMCLVLVNEAGSKVSQDDAAPTAKSSNNNSKKKSAAGGSTSTTKNNNSNNNNNSNSSSRMDNLRLCLIDAVDKCEIVASVPWQSKYTPMSCRSMVALSDADEIATTNKDGDNKKSGDASSAKKTAPAKKSSAPSEFSPTSSWRVTLGVATAQRGFRTLTALLKSPVTATAQEAEQKKGSLPLLAAGAEQQQQQQNISVVDTASSKYDHRTSQLAKQDKIDAFFRKLDVDASSSSASARMMAASGERALSDSTAGRIKIAKAAATYTSDVLNATTFFATAPVSAVASTTFAKLDEEAHFFG